MSITRLHSSGCQFVYLKTAFLHTYTKKGFLVNELVEKQRQMYINSARKKERDRDIQKGKEPGAAFCYGFKRSIN